MKIISIKKKIYSMAVGHCNMCEESSYNLCEICDYCSACCCC